MGHVRELGLDAMSARFGSAGALAWELSGGIDPRPLVPFTPETEVVEEQSLPFGCDSLDVLAETCSRLLRRAYSRPALRGRSAGRVDLLCPVYVSAPWQRTVNFQEPIGDWERAARVVRGKLQAAPPDAPVDGVTLTVSGISSAQGWQPGLFPDFRGMREARILSAERRLQTRLESGAVLHRVSAVAPWHPVPERRAVQTPVDPMAPGVRPFLVPKAVDVREAPDGQPVSVLLRRGWRDVEQVLCSWSVGLWWLPRPVERVYWRVELSGGVGMALFRVPDGRWFRQGK